MRITLFPPVFSFATFKILQSSWGAERPNRDRLVGADVARARAKCIRNIRHMHRNNNEEESIARRNQQIEWNKWLRETRVGGNAGFRASGSEMNHWPAPRTFCVRCDCRNRCGSLLSLVYKLQTRDFECLSLFLHRET